MINNLQNTVMNPNTDFIPNQSLEMMQNAPMSYADNMGQSEPMPMPGNNRPENLYPFESTFNNSFNNPADTIGYRKGGNVKGKKKKKDSPYPALAEMIRQQGSEEDSVLAHINPLEAMMLQQISGNGKPHPVTNLPQYGFLDNPLKALKSIVGSGAGSIIGNMILPGIGGVIGGALGGGVQNTMRGKKFGEGALKGAGVGASMPGMSSVLGSGLSGLGANTMGSALSNYGTQNSIMSALGMGNGAGLGSGLSKIMGSGAQAGSGVGASAGTQLPNALANMGGANVASGAAEQAGNAGFLSKLMGNTSDYLSKPQNLLTAGVVASQLLKKPPKEKTMAEREADLLAEAQMLRRVERNKFLPEERLGNIEPLYIRSNTPQEYQQQGRWLNYYDNPQFTGAPVRMQEGGLIPTMISDDGIDPMYIDGMDGGQDDNIRMDLPENSYIVNASTVSDLGDGNSRAGAEKIKALVSSGEVRIPPKGVKKIGKGSHKKGVNSLDKMVKNVAKHKRGGKINLPPKAKALTSYMRG